MEYEVTQLCKLLFLYVGFFSLFFPGFWMVKWYVWTLWIMGFFVYFLSGKIMLSEKIWFGHFFLFIYLFIYFVSFFLGGGVSGFSTGWFEKQEIMCLQHFSHSFCALSNIFHRECINRTRLFRGIHIHIYFIASLLFYFLFFLDFLCDFVPFNLLYFWVLHYCIHICFVASLFFCFLNFCVILYHLVYFTLVLHYCFAIYIVDIRICK